MKFTDEQLLEWRVAGKTYKSFAREFGVNVRSVERRAAKLAKQGRMNELGIDMAIPAGRQLGMVTAQFKANGELVQYWPRIKEDAEQIEWLKESAKEATTPIPIESIPATSAIKQDTDVIPWFNIGDGHLGMVAYDKEVGHNFDLNIGERELCFAMGAQLELHEGYERCVIQDMGDMTHYENFGAKTEGSGHDLDYDTRFPKMIRTYRRVMEYIVHKALKHFKFVDVIINQGNHSRTNDIWMAEHLRALFSNTERVHVLNNECIFIPYRMGNTFVMSHHSDKCKPARLRQVMTTDFRQDHGETCYHYIDIGHIHHKMQTKEDELITVESFNQLAPADKYAHDGGWRSRSCLTTVLRSKTYGEKGRTVLTAEEVKDRLNGLPAGTTSQQRREVYTV